MFKKYNWKLLLRLGVSAILISWFIISMKWLDIVNILKGISLYWLFAAIGWIIIAVVVSVYKWRKIFEAQGINTEWGDLWKVYWAGLFFNNFLPSSIGGDALRVLWAGKITGDTAGVTTSVVVERILATTGLALVGIIASLFTVHPRNEILLLFSLLVFVSVILVFLLMWGWLPISLRDKDNSFFNFIKSLSQHGKSIRKRPQIVLSVIIWSVVFQLSVVMVNYCIFMGLNINKINLFEAMYIIPATSVAAMLPLGINGYGIREGAYITLLKPYGISVPSAFAASVGFAFIVSICSLWGGWIWLRSKGVGTINDRIESIK